MMMSVPAGVAETPAAAEAAEAAAPLIEAPAGPPTAPEMS